MDVPAAELIERLGVVRRAARRAAAADAGLSLAQLDALRYLASCNRFSNTPAAVAEYLDATRGTTSQSLRALERKGLIAGRSDARDGRVRHLLPTPAGHDVLEATRTDEIERAVLGLGGRSTDLALLLEETLRAAQRARGGRTFGRCGGCRHLRGAPGDHRCGLTGEPLADAETALFCVEHDPVSA